MHSENINMRDTMRPAQPVGASVRSQLRAPMDVQGTAAAPAEPWLPSPPDGFSFPAQMAEVGGASSSSQAAGAAGADVSAVRRFFGGGC